MQKRLLIIITVLLNLLYIQVSGQLKYSINESWHFIKDNIISDVNQFLSQKDDALIVNLPHTWNIEDVRFGP